MGERLENVTIREEPWRRTLGGLKDSREKEFNMSICRVLVLRAPGTNCDHESQFAFESMGAKVDRIHVNRLLEEPKTLEPYQILCLPGGFSYGDDVSAGRILAVEMRHRLGDAFQQFKTQDKLIIGICNGFQVLIQTGLLFDRETASAATLTTNLTGKYEDRWVELIADGSHCVFLRGMSLLRLPVAHGEGRFVARDEATLSMLDSNRRLCLRYHLAGADPNFTFPFPHNPNGSQRNVAGVCDETGRVFGLMPHPERHFDSLQHPNWTRMESLPSEGDGAKIFRNAIEYFR